jgi:hypothetical protein|tara:strand:- start:1968 stop:2276 length:309 start_codon:yes stop_codon:yes gene_type:complete
MFLKINDNYAIESDAMGWAVSKWTEEPKRGKFWKQVSWYSTLENAANGLLQREIRCLEVDNLTEAIKGVEGLATELTEALSPKIEFKSSKFIKYQSHGDEPI